MCGMLQAFRIGFGLPGLYIGSRKDLQCLHDSERRGKDEMMLKRVEIKPSLLLHEIYRYTPTVQNMATTPKPQRTLAMMATETSWSGIADFGRLRSDIKQIVEKTEWQIDSALRGEIESECKRREEQDPGDGRQEECRNEGLELREFLVERLHRRRRRQSVSRSQSGKWRYLELGV